MWLLTIVFNIMKKSFVLFIVAALFTVPSNAQLLNRLSDKAMKAAEKGVTKAVEKSVEKTTEKATEKALSSAEKAVEAQVDRGVNELNATTNELNRYNDSLRAANAEAAAATGGAGLQGLMGSYMTLMGVGTPVYEDKGDEVLLTWDYVNYKLEWIAKFNGDKCVESKTNYINPTEEMAIQFYREQIADLSEAEAKLWSVDGKTVTQDTSEENKDKDKVEIKASMQQVVLSMGGKLE